MHPPSPVLTEEQSLIVARHYLIAGAWADAEEGTSPRPTRQAIQVAQKLAQEFAQQIGPEALQMTINAYTSAGLHFPFATLGHDIYLTMEGHGGGFWDRECLEIPAPDDSRVTLGGWMAWFCEHSRWRNAHGYGLIEFYRGWIYFREPLTKSVNY